MAIKRMISRDLAEFREFQTRTVEVGRIRTGQYVVPEGRKGRPVKLDRFRLTSDKEEHIRAAADQYGGTAQPYAPQGGGPQQWEVVTELGSLEVLIINGQLIDPVYEMWGAGRTCIRRCDGEWNAQTREPCLCNGPDRPEDPRQLCKVTTRVQVMLPSVAGLHAWRLETHSENAAVEMASPTVGGLVRIAQVPVPATLYLRREQRRERNHAEQKFESRDFYVPTFHIRLSALELAAGPEAITAALVSQGAPSALAAPDVRRELGAAPVSAVPAPAPPAPAQTSPVDGTAVLADGELRRILAAVEKAATLDALDKLKEAFAARGVRHPAVFAAWKSKRAEVLARDTMAEEEPPFTDPSDEVAAFLKETLPPEYAIGDTVTVGGIEFTKIRNSPVPCFDAFCASGTNPCGWTPNEHAEAHGATALMDADRAAGRGPDAAEDAVEGTVEDDGTGLPMVPAGEYSVESEWTALLMAAGKLSPPLTTDQVRMRIKATFGVTHPSKATGEQLARLRLFLQGVAV